VLITNAEGDTLTFVVIKQETYPRDNAPLEKIFGSSESRFLNLITCTGTYNVKERTHENRLVVYTELKD
jgi:sortase A